MPVYGSVRDNIIRLGSSFTVLLRVMHPPQGDCCRPASERDGLAYLAADVESVTYALTREYLSYAEFILQDEEISVGSTWHDYCQGWPIDRRGYNFKHVVPPARLDRLHARYTLIYSFHLVPPLFNEEATIRLSVV